MSGSEAEHGNLQPQGNANRRTGDPNATCRDNGHAHSSADTRGDANPATETNVVAL